MPDLALLRGRHCAAVVLQLPRRICSAMSHLLRRGCVDSEDQREAELHLYVVSQMSRLYLHLQSSWTSFIIVSDDVENQQLHL